MGLNISTLTRTHTLDIDATHMHSLPHKCLTKSLILTLHKHTHIADKEYSCVCSKTARYSCKGPMKARAEPVLNRLACALESN